VITMKKHSAIALLLVAIMAVSVFSAVDLATSTKVEAATSTVTFLSTPAFANVGQPFTISGNVKTSTGSFVSGGQVTLYRYLPTGLLPFKILNVGYGGQFSTTHTTVDVGPYFFQAKYLGTTRYGQQYAPSTSAVRTTYVKYGTTMTIAAYHYPQYRYVTGTVKTLSGGAVPNQLIYIYKLSAATGNRWVLYQTVRTDSGGGWRAADNTPYTTNYYAQFPETSAYFGSRTSVTPGV
jgi:hypothetical protein